MITKEMKEIIGVCYLAAFDIDPRNQPSSLRRLLTLLLAAVKENKETEHINLIIECINECEKARVKLDDPDPDWTSICRKCDKVLDKITPLVFGGYAVFKDTSSFGMLTTGVQK
jgi:hypothetical protein